MSALQQIDLVQGHSIYDLADYQNGRAFKPSEVGEEGLPVIKIAELNRGITPSTKRFAGPVEQRHRIHRGDLLFAWSGSVGVHVWNGPEAALNQHIFKVTARRDVDQRFIRYLLEWHMPVFERIVQDQATTMGHVKIRDLRRLRVKVQPLEDQRAIAGMLGALDDKIELNRRMTQTANDLAATEFRRSCERQGRLTALGELTELVMGSSPPGATYNEVGLGLPFYQGIRDFGDRYPAPRVWCSAPVRTAEPRDVLISVRAPVGNLNVALEKCCIGRGLAAARSEASPSTLFYALAESREAFLPFEASGTVFGAIKRSELLDLGVRWLPDDARHDFESFAAPLDRLIRSLTLESRTLAALRNTLLPKLVSGELLLGDMQVTSSPSSGSRQAPQRSV